jgi:heme/copper-type cytochrome/quinol oxidase subunit 3
MIFGTVFLGVKAIEYTKKYKEGIVPVAGLNLRTAKTASTHPNAAENFQPEPATRKTRANR